MLALFSPFCAKQERLALALQKVEKLLIYPVDIVIGFLSLYLSPLDGDLLGG